MTNEGKVKTFIAVAWIGLILSGRHATTKETTMAETPKQRIAMLELKLKTMEGLYDAMLERVSMLEIATGLAFGDPHQQADVFAAKCAADEQRQAFNKQNPENPI